MAKFGHGTLATKLLLQSIRKSAYFGAIIWLLVYHVQIWPSMFMDFHCQNDWFIQHLFKMLRFNVMDIHERPSMAMTLSTGYASELAQIFLT